MPNLIKHLALPTSPLISYAALVRMATDTVFRFQSTDTGEVAGDCDADIDWGDDNSSTGADPDRGGFFAIAAGHSCSVSGYLAVTDRVPIHVQPKLRLIGVARTNPAQM